LLARAGVPHGFGAVADGDFRRGEPPAGIALARQVHGTDVVRAVTPGRSGVEADALLASRQVGAGVVTADCVPILIADPEASLAAAVHAGWRGTLNGVVRRTLEALLREGAELPRLRVAIGPCIRSCCYEVSEDLQAQFVAEFGSRVAHPGSRLDLALSIREHITSVGIPSANVDDLAECTRCGRQGDMYVYFSHRRSGEAAGRQLSWVCASTGPLS
jgi:YfiH family protein